jgi:Fe-S-cluster-containing dehydrogenase component
MMILSGFARITEQLDYGERTLGYATRRDVFGLEEIVGVWRGERSALLDRSLRAVGCVDILRVPTDLVEAQVLPGLPPELIPASRPGGLMAPAWKEDDRVGLQQSLVDFLVDNRTINGTATMLIDTDRCTGCDDCVRACAETHDNNPRFVRHGLSHGPIQVATACMHCSDPVCLIGCPTGAIARNLSDGRVLIDDRTCIGCGTCANSCPYNNIRLVEIRDAEGRFILDKEMQTPILKATKCDLCYGQLGGPACQRACPHDALIRIDMGDQDSLRAWIGRK